MEAPSRSCQTCRFYVPREVKLGPMRWGYNYATHMICAQRMTNVHFLVPCYLYEREPGAD